MIESDPILLRRRRLPHQDVLGHPIFITACLHGSLPAAGLAKINKFREQLDARRKPNQEITEKQWQNIKHKMLFAFVDQLLDHESPVNHLADPRQAEIVWDAFYHFADERYKLMAFVVMPSHHHWLFLPDEEWATRVVKDAEQAGKKFQTPREIISHSIQSYTATMCNRVRGETGQYWQHETFDHWARDEEEAIRIIRYIEMNPVKAGLANRPEDYRYSSAHVRHRLRLSVFDPIPKMGHQ